jgi:hypothetical protein
MLAVMMVAVGAGGVAAEDPSQAIVRKAIQAHGGSVLITKYPAVETKTHGQILLGQGIGITQTTYFQLPNQLKEVQLVNLNGQRAEVITVFDGEKAWMHTNGQTQELAGQALREVKESVHLARLCRLTTLLAKDLQLTAIPAVKVDGADLVGVKVSAPGYRDVSLFFDQNSGMLTRIERQAFDFTARQEVPEVRTMSNYKYLSGVRVARNILLQRGGKKYMEIEVVDAKPLPELEHGTFARP